MSVRVQFGHGGHILEGWLNLEQHQADITKPLAFKDDSVDFVFTEHCVEHVTPQQGYKFLMEANRILKSNGVIRVIVPDITNVWRHCNPAYLSLPKEGIKTWWPAAGWKQPTDNPTVHDAVESLIFCHGHQSIYNSSLLQTVMESADFATEPCKYGKSNHPELNGIDSHWKYMGLENCVLESCVVEGTKI
jgi:predicted SAM-dependent methyltransferase